MPAMPQEEGKVFTPNALFTVRQEWLVLHVRQGEGEAWDEGRRH
jgi:hypothetical protein